MRNAVENRHRRPSSRFQGRGRLRVRPSIAMVIAAGLAVPTVRAAPAAASPQPVKFVYVANTQSDTVSVINAVTNRVTTTIPVGRHPLEIALSPNATRAYVTNQGSDTVSVINTTTGKVTATIPVDDYP